MFSLLFRVFLKATGYNFEILNLLLDFICKIYAGLFPFGHGGTSFTFDFIVILAQIDDADSIFAFLVFFVNPNAGLLLASAQLCYRIVGVAKMDGSAKGVNMFLAMPITLFLVGFEAVVIGSAVVSIVADVE